MRSARTISVVGCHAAGEVGDVIVGGVLPPEGATMFDKKLTMERDHDDVRRLLLREPRGSIARHVNLVLPATRPDCDAGLIIMEPTEYPPMSGSNTIATVTVLLETGMVAMRQPETVVRLDTPGGLVVATATCSDGKCDSVRIENVPSFAHTLDAQLDVDGLGPLTVDVAYGGMYYAIVDADRLGLRVASDNARTFVDLADRIRIAAQEQLEVVHPENPGIRDVTMVQFAEAYRGPDEPTPNTCVMAAGRSDRCPTGTGTSARMAVLHARGHMSVGDTLIHSSIIGTTFTGTIASEVQVGGLAGIVPTVEGQAWITGFHQYCVDVADPFPRGFLVPDTFGGSELLAAMAREQGASARPG